MSYEKCYAAQQQQKTSKYADSAKAHAERNLLRAAHYNSRKDVSKRYPTITASNIESVAEYQQERIEFWLTKLKTNAVAE
jgi:hypothetical protein